MSQEPTPSGAKAPAVYTEEFKRSVVDHWCHSDKTAEQVAKDFGVKVWNVRDWRRRYGPTHKPVDAPLPETSEELRREVQQLRKELARVTTQHPHAFAPKAHKHRSSSAAQVTRRTRGRLSPVGHVKIQVPHYRGTEANS